MTVRFLLRRAGWAARRRVVIGLLSLSALGTGPEPGFAATGSPRFGSLLVFGDSYSAVGGAGIRNWSQ